jgi:aminopeptidase N
MTVRWFARIVTCLIASVVTTAADTYPRQPGVDALHYRFAIEIADGTAHIDGETGATFRLLGDVPFIEVDLRSATASGGMTVRRVTRGAEDVPFSHAADRLRLPVPSTARVGDELTYTITYSGDPGAGLPLATNMHGERVRFSESWPDQARLWLPVIDHPSDKATGEFVITAPARWQVVANGMLVEEVDLPDDRRRTHWRQSAPIATWLYAIGVARFHAHHHGLAAGVPLQTWAFPQDAVAARTLFAETSRRVLEFFSARIGPYPYEKLANVQATGWTGALENATVIFYGEKAVASGRGPVAHEVAHQWFGNSVTQRDWDEIWLSEGFATYFALLYREHAEGRDPFVEALRRDRTTVLEAARKTPDTAVVHRELSDMQNVLNRFVYAKGSWMLHMLRRQVGDAAFWEGIREYYRRYRDRNASSDDFRQVMEQVSGAQLQRFFSQWLTRGGQPALATTWRYDPGKRLLELTIRQTQPGEPYALAVDVGLSTAAGLRTETIHFDTREASVRWALEAEPREVLIDPHTWLLADLALPARR